MNYLIKNKALFINVVFFLCSVFLLIYPAIINGYPLVYSDSGAYIASGFDCHVPVDRPIMYAFFVRHISMARSLWFVVTLQAMIVTYMVSICYKCFLKDERHYLYSFISILFLSFTTGISSYTSQIMPDIFSPVAILGVCLLVSFPDLKKSIKITLGILIIFSNMAHSSNLINLTAITVTIIIVRWLFRKFISINVKQVYLVASFVLFSWLIIPSMNAMLGAGFKVSRAPNIFIMGRLVESGILNTYLHDKCETQNMPLCKYIDHLPDLSFHFLWEPESPLYDGGCVDKDGHRSDCWLIKNHEYDPIVKEIFSTPKYLKMFLTYAAKESWRQLYSFEIEELATQMEGSPVIVNIQWRYKKEYAQYISAEQAYHRITYKKISFVQNILIGICLLCFVLLLFLKARKSVSTNLKLFILVAVLGIIYNAIICATFSMVTDRFQARVIWLIPLALFITIFSLIQSKKISTSL